MVEPTNFINETLDGVMANWLASLQSQSVRAIVVIGPDHKHVRQKAILAVYPPRMVSNAQWMLNTPVPLESLGESNYAPLVGWMDLTDEGDERLPEWVTHWKNSGFRGAMRIAFEIVSHRDFECYLLCEQARLNRDMQAALVWSTLSLWPKVRRLACNTRSPLSGRELQCLRLAFEGLTANETAEALGCGVRTVNFHLTNAMAKLDTRNKLEAIQKACWLGVL